MNDSPHSIAGGWLGAYAYSGRDADKPPVRFEAAWAATGDEGRFTGTVLDEDGGGEAETDGMQSGHQVAFTKVYVARAESYLHPVAYEGALSEDGMTVQGTWRIKEATGTWDARRLWSPGGAQDARQEEATLEVRRPLAGAA